MKQVLGKLLSAAVLDPILASSAITAAERLNSSGDIVRCSEAEGYQSPEELAKIHEFRLTMKYYRGGWVGIEDTIKSLRARNVGVKSYIGIFEKCWVIVWVDQQERPVGVMSFADEVTGGAVST